MRRVAVLGRGIAGAAAGWAAKRAGAAVISFGGAPLASTMSSGAADDEPWELGRPPRPLEDDVRAFFDELGTLTLPEASSALVATSAGVLRPARGHDAFVLDLASLGAGTIGVPRLARPGWDADALVLSWNDEPSARAQGLRFEAIDADLLHRTDERVLPEVDLAARIADPRRRRLLDARLETLSKSARYVALLAPSGLGLRDASPLPLGEVLSPPGGPAGRRLGAALEGVLPRSEGALASLRVGAEREERWAVASMGSPADARGVQVDAVVLAVGGVVGGGIGYRRTDPAAVLSPIPTFHADVFPPALVGLHADAAAIELPLGEPRWSQTSGGPLERVGILHADGAVRRDDGGTFASLFVAGDAAAGRPRTLIAAVRGALHAGTAAARNVTRS